MNTKVQVPTIHLWGDRDQIKEVSYAARHKIWMHIGVLLAVQLLCCLNAGKAAVCNRRACCTT